ncbi:MAG: bacteriohemerythrin [Rhodospirillales bacterium]
MSSFEPKQENPAEKLLLLWEDEFSVDVVSVDDEHRELFRLFNLLVETVFAGAPFDDVMMAFEALLNHTVMHFAHEERIMENIDLPQYSHHKEQHGRLLSEAKSVAEGLTEEATVEELTAILAYLRLWILRHIMLSDKGIYNFLHR